MLLPNKIEKELQVIESWLWHLPGQKAGNPRLRDLRYAIEEFLRSNGLRWNSPQLIENNETKERV